MGIRRQMPPDPMQTESPKPAASPRRTRLRALATIAVLAIVVAVVVIAVL